MGTHSNTCNQTLHALNVYDLYIKTPIKWPPQSTTTTISPQNQNLSENPKEQQPVFSPKMLKNKKIMKSAKKSTSQHRTPILCTIEGLFEETLTPRPEQ